MQTRRIAKSAKGIRGHLSRQLYNAAAVPAMLYGASVWLTPIVRSSIQRIKSKGSVGAADKLARVQRLAALHITGAMCTTAGDTLNAHANLLPMELLIDKHCYREALRLATIPPMHPLFKHVKSAAHLKPKHLPAPLHEIMHAYSLHPAEIERILAVRHDPYWLPPVITRIAPDREAALREEEMDNAPI